MLLQAFEIDQRFSRPVRHRQVSCHANEDGSVPTLLARFAKKGGGVDSNTSSTFHCIREIGKKTFQMLDVDNHTGEIVTTSSEQDT